MDALNHDSLNYSKAVRQELPLAPGRPWELLRGMLDSYPEFQGTAAEIVIDSQIPLVMGNEAALTQCFSNLLGNAVKFVDPGRRAKVRVFAEKPADGWVRITVEDNGIAFLRLCLPRFSTCFPRGASRTQVLAVGLPWRGSR
jgi:signal transduction histidine kinase